jgi:hypothetical protein
MFAHRSGCPPLVGAYVGGRSSGESGVLRSWLDAAGFRREALCKRHYEAVLGWIVRNRIATVILGGHWVANIPDPENAAVFARALQRVLILLQPGHVRVFVLEDVPQNSRSVPYELASARRLGLRRDFRMSRTAYEAQQQSATRIFAPLQQRYGLRLLRPQDILCAGGLCAIARGADPLYVDDEHLSATGAMLVEPAFEAVFTDSSW